MTAQKTFEIDLENTSTFKRIIILAFGIGTYVLFLLTVLYAINFVGDYGLLNDVDNGSQNTIIIAIVVNIFFVLLFGFQHTIMARENFKNWLEKVIPQPIERSFYVLCATLTLILLFTFWEPIPQTIWNFQSGLMNYIMTGLFWLGWIDIIFCTFLISHFDLFGVRQVYYYFIQKPYEPVEFKEPIFYKYIRHPLMFGFLIGFWATAHMTVGHLLFAGLMTIYMFIGIKFEEQSLVKNFGESYKKYQAEVSMIIPIPRK